MIRIPYRLISSSIIRNNRHPQPVTAIQQVIKKNYHTTTVRNNSNNDDYNENYLDFVNENMLPSSTKSTNTSAKTQHALFEEQLLELKHEREELFGFTEDEKSSWTKRGTNDSRSGRITADELNEMRASMDDVRNTNVEDDGFTNIREKYKQPQQQPFSHVSAGGESVSMVDVGLKQVTRRTARARSIVVFPPEVMHAFQIQTNENELIGPKGPIFSTARLAGIMAAKRTSELIPLCHPLPLERVHIEISLDNNKATIECECCVTHKTGVEMEALTGASIAALTIYDMVKAVSHRVQIQNTVLVSKTGGKTNIR